MKKLLYGILATLLLTNISVAQTTTLMSDGDYRIMMNDYTNNINNILKKECPDGVTIDQFKKKIVTGELKISGAAQEAITTYAAPLRKYAEQFINANPSLRVPNDSYLYFFASFAPSTRIDNSYYPGSLLESDVNGGLKATEMWDCAMQSFNVEDCATQTVVQDKKNLNKLAGYCVTKLTPNAGFFGILVLIDEFYNCVEREKLINSATWEIVNEIINRYEKIFALVSSYTENSTEDLELQQIGRYNSSNMTDKQAEMYVKLLGYNSIDEFSNERVLLTNQITEFSKVLGLSNINQSINILYSKIKEREIINNTGKIGPCLQIWQDSMQDCRDTAWWGSIGAIAAGGFGGIAPGIVAAGVVMGQFNVCKRAAQRNYNHCMGY